MSQHAVDHEIAERFAIERFGADQVVRVRVQPRYRWHDDEVDAVDIIVVVDHRLSDDAARQVPWFHEELRARLSEAAGEVRPVVRFRLSSEDVQPA